MWSLSLLWQIPVSVILLGGVLYGIIESILHDNLGHELQEWPSRRSRERLRHSRLPRDSHAQAYVDGFITAKVLEDLDDMFK